MYRYIMNRLLLVIPTLVGAAALVFVLMRLIPGDICVVRLGSGGGNVDPRAVAACHAQLGLDRPVILQFVDFVWGLLSRRLRHLDVVGQAGRRGDRRAPPDLARDRRDGDRGRHPDRDPARHDLGAEAEQLDRSCGAHGRDRGNRNAVVLARHHVHPGRARDLARGLRRAMDAADRLCPVLGGSAAQSVDGDPARAHRRLPLRPPSPCG